MHLVPPELLGQCIWALEWFIRALLDGSELQLRTFGHILPHQQLDEARYFMVGTSPMLVILP